MAVVLREIGNMNTPHVHAELIKKWADGSRIECELYPNHWEYIASPTWMAHKHYRVQPERVFPKSNLTYAMIQQEIVGNNSLERVILNIADAAVKQYILDTEKNGIEYHV